MNKRRRYKAKRKRAEAKRNHFPRWTKEEIADVKRAARERALRFGIDFGP